MLFKVGLKKNTGGETKISAFGLNAAETIQAIGRKKNIETSHPPIVASLIGPDLRFGLNVVSAIIIPQLSF